VRRERGGHDDKLRECGGRGRGRGRRPQGEGEAGGGAVVTVAVVAVVSCTGERNGGTSTVSPSRAQEEALMSSGAAASVGNGRCNGAVSAALVVAAVRVVL
jgi:hypothetical protein